eukprot:TRINITY_DN6231_c0_g1_i1.p1 TRINITY_DN6231_c0_g1~~TRINITY_DN6231_c0_g1_i1.p1  ORF type:complete len:528 (-),score=111.67 TRINITY_DN6231_c0_g1_i1:183-1766(-)
MKHVEQFVCQTRPALTLPVWLRWASLAVLAAVSLMTFAVRWTYPTLQGAGMQCSSCATADAAAAFQERCRDHCLSLSDVQMGIVTGPAISISAMVASLPLGWMADNGSRVRLLFVCTLLWSIGALASSFSSSFLELLIACVWIGFGQGGVNPCSFSLLGDLFAQNRRGLVFALFGSLIYFGYDLGALGGVISEYSSWRTTLWVFGGLSLALTIPLLLLREPRRGMSEATLTHVRHGKQLLDYSLIDEDSVSGDEDEIFNSYKDKDGLLSTPHVEDGEEEEYGMPRSKGSSGGGGVESNASNPLAALKEVFSEHAFTAHWVSSLCRFIAGCALGAWMPVFYRRVFGLAPSVVSLWMTLILLVSGLGGSTAGGGAADMWIKRDGRGRMWVCALSGLLAVPFMLGMLLIDSAAVSFVCLFGASFFAEAWFGPAMASAQELVPVHVRALSTSVFLIAAGLGGVSPLFVGALNSFFGVDAPFSDPLSSHASYDPTLAMIVVIPGFYVLASAGFVLTALLMRAAMGRDDTSLL